MKNLIPYLIVILFSSSLVGQSKYFTKDGSIIFEASVPSFEEVKAKSNTVSAVLDLDSGEIAALALVKGFRFKVALMEEHFNESFAESDKFPKATFQGKIEDFSIDKLSSNSKTFILNGKLTFHGKTVAINPNVAISTEKNNIHLTSNFILIPEDFDIKIPSIVRKKVAETVDVAVNFILIPKK
jgi:hypothetical protein